MRFNFKSAVWAGIVATFVMVIIMGLMGLNPLKKLGLGLGIEGTLRYVVGGVIYFVIGIIYAVIYALIFEPLFKKMPRIVSGAIYGLFPFIVTMVLGISAPKVGAMPLGVAVPCGPCGGLAPDNPPAQTNPCNPCAPCNGCNPCTASIIQVAHRPLGVAVPCGPCGGLKQTNPPSQMPTTNPAAQPKPQAGQGWLWCLLNNIIYGAVLGLVYRPKH